MPKHTLVAALLLAGPRTRRGRQDRSWSAWRSSRRARSDHRGARGDPRGDLGQPLRGARAHRPGRQGAAAPGEAGRPPTAAPTRSASDGREVPRQDGLRFGRREVRVRPCAGAELDQCAEADLRAHRHDRDAGSGDRRDQAQGAFRQLPLLSRLGRRGDRGAGTAENNKANPVGTGPFKFKSWTRGDRSNSCAIPTIGRRTR